MPSAIDIPNGVYKNEAKRWVRKCPVCNAAITHLRRNYCIHAHLLKQPCKKCSNIKNHPSGMSGAVRVAWYESFRKSAISRGYEWSITLDTLNMLYEKQGKLCAFSGLPIGWSSVAWIHTASIDRIDNSRGYTEDNVHLVHKKVNMMRGTMSVEDFVEMCCHICNHVKW